MERPDAVTGDTFEKPVFAPPPFTRTAQEPLKTPDTTSETPVNKVTVALLGPIFLPFYLPVLLFQALYFVVEVFFEILYLSTSRNRSESRNTMIKELPLPVSAPRGRFQPTCTYPAIVVSSVSLDSISAGVRVADLPTQTVQLPVDDISKIAVVSWKWDFDHERRSKNLASIIKYARSAGIQYLFADIVSIDQNSEAETLISHVAAFSSLYKTIPVLAAYDHKNMNFKEIMLRPWIHREINIFIETSTKIIYVGHNHQGTWVSGSVFDQWLGRPPKSQLRRTRFARQLAQCWSFDESESVLFVLNGTTNMTNIFDFKYIIPGFGSVFTRAEVLYRNDYLLTVLLLLIAARQMSDDGPYFLMDNYFLGLDYAKYRFETQHSTILKDEKYEYEYIHTAYLGTREVGTFTYYTLCEPNIHTGKHHSAGFQLKVLPDTEESIFDMLQLGTAEREEFELQKGKRQAKIHAPTSRFSTSWGRTIVGRPGMGHIDVVSVHL